jgi:hypothetical protein
MSPLAYGNAEVTTIRFFRMFRSLEMVISLPREASPPNPVPVSVSVLSRMKYDYTRFPDSGQCKTGGTFDSDREIYQ